MAQKKGDALSGHLTFYPAAVKGFGQVQQILHDHSFCKFTWIYITIINKKKAKFAQVITNSLRTVMTDR